jgi:hypothetical protein
MLLTSVGKFKELLTSSWTGCVHEHALNMLGKMHPHLQQDFTVAKLVIHPSELPLYVLCPGLVSAQAIWFHICSGVSALEVT